MVRGTFANIRLVNKLSDAPGPQTRHLPSGDKMDIFDAAERLVELISVMARGTFANIRLVNKLSDAPGPQTRHLPSGDKMDIFDAAESTISHGARHLRQHTPRELPYFLLLNLLQVDW
ncbi:unnamed protein product [Plutella xylostella]|uniref:(diamondback moth) hypothetical protein n=1 Tax=Plutella xylostella TaxID=51655 RepID=A0A8S4G4Q5_PLUXY|nr:unnamed protein product [Plutella xylostella]